jgi:hypothetical protein
MAELHEDIETAANTPPGLALKLAAKAGLKLVPARAVLSREDTDSKPRPTVAPPVPISKLQPKDYMDQKLQPLRAETVGVQFDTTTPTHQPRTARAEHR